jgi:VWFA-related protein
MKQFRFPGAGLQHSTRVAIFALPLICGYSCPQSPAQTSSPQAFITLSARLVVLDVVVTDKAGNPVRDLTAQDFKVFEDKVPQTIRNFEGTEEHRLPPDVAVHSTADLARIREAPVTILVLDELDTRFEDMSFARNALKGYLLRQPSPLTQPVQLVVAGNSRFQVLTDYTRDRDKVLADLDRHFPEYPWRLMQSGKSGPGTAERLAMTLSTLEQIAQATAGHAGRKNVVWVGRGFPSVNTNQTTDKDAAVIQNAAEKAVNTLLDARITLYTIDPTINSTDMVDLETPDDLDLAEDENGGDPFAGDVNFQSLAPATGGRVYFSRNDVDDEIGASIRNGGDYYTLSYAPTNDNDLAQPYRRITIKLKNPKLIATTRNGYYTHSEDAAVQGRGESAQSLKTRLAYDLGSAANNNLSYTALGCSATQDRLHASNFMVHVDAHAVSWRDAANGKLEAEVTLLVASFNRQNKMLAHSIREMTTETSPAQPGTDRFTTADFVTSAEIPAGTARLRFVIRDAATGKIGTVDFNLPGTR